MYFSSLTQPRLLKWNDLGGHHPLLWVCGATHLCFVEGIQSEEIFFGDRTGFGVPLQFAKDQSFLGSPFLSVALSCGFEGKPKGQVPCWVLAKTRRRLRSDAGTTQSWPWMKAATRPPDRNIRGFAP